MFLFVAAAGISAAAFYGLIKGYSRLKKAHAIVAARGSEGVFRTAAATVREAVTGGSFSMPDETESETLKEIEGGNLEPRLVVELRREGVDIESLQMVRGFALRMLVDKDPVARRAARKEAMDRIKAMGGDSGKMLAEIERIERDAAGGKYAPPDENVVRKFIASVRRSYSVIQKEMGRD